MTTAALEDVWEGVKDLVRVIVQVHVLIVVQEHARLIVKNSVLAFAMVVLDALLLVALLALEVQVKMR